MMPTLFRRRFAELAIEAGMVVFAVLIAFAVDEWREERQLREFAGRARASVEAEMRANIEEFDATVVELDSVQTLLARVVSNGDVSLLNESLRLELPEPSSAAWRAAQSSVAAAYLDYAWVIRASRAYEVNEMYTRVAESVIDDMAALIGVGPTVETLQPIYGRLVILSDMHRQVRDRFQSVLAEDAPSGR
jgi:hypothetical protein